MLTCELAAHPQPRLVQQPPADHAVGPREVDELEHAQALAAAEHRGAMGAHAIGVDGEDLPRFDVAHHLRTHGIQRSALRRDRPTDGLAIR